MHHHASDESVSPMIVHTQSFTPDIVDATINHSAGKCDLEWHCERLPQWTVCGQHSFPPKVVLQED